MGFYDVFAAVVCVWGFAVWCCRPSGVALVFLALVSVSFGLVLLVLFLVTVRFAAGSRTMVSCRFFL